MNISIFMTQRFDTQSSVFNRGDLKWQHGYLYSRDDVIYQSVEDILTVNNYRRLYSANDDGTRLGYRYIES